MAVGVFSPQVDHGGALPVPSSSGFTTFRFKIKATDTDGLLNGEGDEFEFTIKDDQLPTVEIVQPKEWSREDRTAIAGFDIAALAKDDYGIVAAQLVVDRIRRENSDGAAAPAAGPATQPAARSHWEIPPGQAAGRLDRNDASRLLFSNPIATAALGATFEPADGTPDLKSFSIGYHWELPELKDADLKKGDVLEYYIKVKDNFMLEDKVHPVSYFSSYRWVKSGKVTITIISMQEFMQRKEIEVAQVQQGIKLQAASEHLQNLQTETLKAGLEKTRKFDPADQAQTERLARDQSQTQTQTTEQADSLKKMLKEMAENKAPKEGLQKNIAEVEADLRKTANKEMREARNNLDAARDPQFAKADADPKPGDPKGDPKPNDPQASDPKAGDPKPAIRNRAIRRLVIPRLAIRRLAIRKPVIRSRATRNRVIRNRVIRSRVIRRRAIRRPGDPKAGEGQ